MISAQLFLMHYQPVCTSSNPPFGRQLASYAPSPSSPELHAAYSSAWFRPDMRGKESDVQSSMFFSSGLAQIKGGGDFCMLRYSCGPVSL
jgi:hypothetical protein